MGCLYCGKDIGPFQFLRDDEFCSAEHRRSYSQRLARGLARAFEPDPAANATAGFIAEMALKSGSPSHAASFRFQANAGHAVELPDSRQLGISHVLGSEPRRLAAAPNAAAPDACPRPATAPPSVQADPMACPRSLAAPKLDLDPAFEAPAAPQVEPAAPPLAASWGLVPRPEPAARLVRSRSADPAGALAAPALPDCLKPAMGRRSLPPSGCWLPAQPAEPVMARVEQFAAMEPCASGSGGAQRLPTLAGVEPMLDSAFGQGRPPQTQVESALPPSQANPSRVAAGPAPPAVAVRLRQPNRTAAPAGLSTAEPVLPRDFSRPVPSLHVRSGAPSPVPAAPPPPPALPPLDMAPAAEDPLEEVYPVADFIALEYYSQRIRGSALIELRSIAAPRQPAQLPATRLELLAVRPGDLALPKPATKAPAKLVAMAARAKPVTAARTWWHAAGAIAAGVFIGLFVWGGASLLRMGLTSSPAKPGLFAPAVSVDVSNAPAPSNPAVVATRAPAAKGPTAWVRNAVAKRATVEFSDTFRGGMSAWGERPSAWAPGWSRNPDGYVRPGQLALFRPSLAYSNYHLDFFTQIESKSVGWVVRARDPKNYYAMKFKVVEPGLRPIIAMVHYTVLGGKQGRRVEIPLSVMVHNNEPYHVAVEVKGNRMVTSIEGQEIDSFTDNTLTSGGVGFFADAGEKARLYWMRVTANNDFVGRVCAYVAAALGQESPAAARLQTGEAPMSAPGPSEPPGEIALGAALGFWKNRRSEPWAC